MRGLRRIAVPLAGFAALAVVVAVLPAFISDFRAQQLAYVAIYLTAILGLNVLTGYTGQISLGHGAFMAIGGYTTAILMSEGTRDVLPLLDSGMKDVWTIPIAMVVAGVTGLLFGIPALRLSGLYLALATFAVAVATPALIKKFEHFTGGGSGINLFGTPELTASVTPVEVLGLELNFNNWLYALCWLVALIAYVAAWLILRGRTGRAFRAVRDSETAAMSSGVSLAHYKTLAFGISAAFAGAAGALFTIANTFVNPDAFPVTLSIYLLVGVVVGGLGSLVGLIAGAVLIVFLPIWAQDADSIVPDWLPLLGDLNTSSQGAPFVVFGLVLILLMFLLPTGFSGLLRRLQSLTSRGYDRVKS